MVIHFLNSIFNAAGIRVIFTTLIHSLWLGAIMALIAAIIIILTKRSGPQLRYKMLTGLLILFIASTLYVFFNVLTNEMNFVKSNNVSITANDMVTSQRRDIQEQNRIVETFTSFIETHADIIVFIWFVVICFKCIQLVSGLRSVYQLKKRNITEAGSYWNKRMCELAAKINIAKPVELFQSSLAKVPMVIGHLKPVILFPIGILNALPQNEVEAILLHELAHIARNDFLINLLQQFIEILFFFNPAVLWVSSLIKSERENCCDDIAITVIQDKRQFIHALVTFQEYNTGLSYATTFNGSKNHLLDRVKRIITNNNKTLNNMEKLILVSGIMMTCIVTVAFSSGYSKDEKEAVKMGVDITAQTGNVDNTTTIDTKYQTIDDTTEKYLSDNDTLPKKETTADSAYAIKYEGEIDGKRILLEEENGRIKELSIDGKKISEDQYDQYKTLVDKIHRNIKDDSAKLKMDADLLKHKKEEMQKQAEIMQKESEKMKEQSIIVQKEFKEQAELTKRKQLEMEEQAEVMSKNDLSTKEQLKKMQKDFIKQQEQFKIKQAEFQKKVEELKLQQQLKEMIKDSLKIKSGARKQPAIYTKPIISVKPSVAVNSTVSAKPVPNVTAKNTVGIVSNVKADPAIAAKPSAEIVIKTSIYSSSTSISDDIIHELEDANIITTRNNLSFHFTNNELIVNGVKQPDALHQKLLKKYVTKPGETISLSYSNHE